MNRVFAYILTIVFVTISSGFGDVVAYGKKKYAEIKFEKTTIDIGTFSQEEPIVTFFYHFKNIGTGNLIIESVRKQCNCSEVEFPEDSIAPGASGKIKVVYDGKGKIPGPINKFISVFTNSKESDGHVKLKFTGYMSEMSPEDIRNGVHNPIEDAEKAGIENRRKKK